MNMAEQQISTCQEQRKKAFISLEANKFILAGRFKEAKLKQTAKMEQLELKRMEQLLKHKQAAKKLEHQQLLLTSKEPSSHYQQQPRLKYEQQEYPRLSYEGKQKKEEEDEDDDLKDFDIDLEGMKHIYIIYVK
jgi:hypothetical protein